MIQDISPYELDNRYQDRTPEPEDAVLVFKERRILCDDAEDGPVRFPTVSEIRNAARSAASMRYLFRISDRYYYLLLPEEHGIEPASCFDEIPGYSYEPLLYMKMRGDDTFADFVAATAFHLYTWYDRNRFCGRCGSAGLTHGETERMLRCPDCGNMIFPVIAPAVIIGVTWGDKILMTKYADREYEGWALLAGFCEIGETVEDTVRREAMEEAGVRIKNLRYAGSQPWGSDSNLLTGFFCDVDGDPTIHMDEAELKRAVWVDRTEMPPLDDDNLSLTKDMIERFRRGEE